MIRKVFIIIIMMMLFGLEGCVGLDKGIGSMSNDSIVNTGGNEDLVIVGCPRGNEPGISFSSAMITKKLYDCCYSQGAVSFINVDGNPKVIYQTDIPELEVSGLSASKKKSIAEGYTNQLINEISNLRANVAEADTLKAISYAAKILSGDQDNSDKTMLIMDNGLSTLGYLDFTKGLLCMDTDSIIKELEEAEAIPDLTGVSVEWMYLGQTSEPQPELSEIQKHKLEDIWSTLLEAGGARSVEFTNDIVTDDAESGLPKVSVVDVQEREIQVEKLAESVENIVNEPIDTFVLDNTDVKFVGDKAEFVNTKKATKKLKEYSEVLLSHPDNKVYVIGTTASGSKDFCNRLSINRANEVCDILISCGVPESQLIPIGMGCDDPWHIEDLDSRGRQIEKYAAKNRKVLIVDVTGEDASKIS